MSALVHWLQEPLAVVLVVEEEEGPLEPELEAVLALVVLRVEVDLEPPSAAKPTGCNLEH